MKQFKIIFNLSWVVCLVLIVGGLQNLNAQDSDSAMVMSENQAFYYAFKNADIKKMDKVWVHNNFVSSIHPMSTKIILGWKDVRDSFDGVFKNYTSIDIKPVNIVVHIEGNIAWVLQNEDFTAMQGNKKIKLESGATNIFIKNFGKWLMVHHQATVAMKM
jgi:hypothetical protein